MPGIAPSAAAALDALARAHGLPDVEVRTGSTSAFRLRARLAIRGRVNSTKVGLFELDSHRIVHIPDCRVQHPLINRVAGIVRSALVDASVPSYSDEAHKGLARNLQVVVERSSRTAQVVLVGNAPDAGPLMPCLNLIRDRLGTDLHSLWFNANTEQTNVILGPHFEHLCGSESVVEHFGGPAIHYPPGAFGQSNLEIAEAIIHYIRTLIPQGARVAELYAGVGAIGLSMLDLVREITLNEISPQSLHGLSLGIAGLGASARAKVRVVPGAAGVAYPAAIGMAAANGAEFGKGAAINAQVIVADPPRKGLDGEFAKHLSESPPERFIYVSCGLDSFIRDVAQLTACGKLRLASLVAFNLIPFTEHVESVACFDRVDT